MVAGDPCQLPPIIASPAAISKQQQQQQFPSQQAAARHPALERSLLGRLVAAGQPTTLLRRQYRYWTCTDLMPPCCTLLMLQKPATAAPNIPQLLGRASVRLSDALRGEV